MSRRRDEAKRARREARQTTDPVGLPGTIAGPELDPYARNGVVVDASNAVLLDYSSACVAHMTRDGKPAADAIAITLGGRVNQRTERAEGLYLTDEDGLVAVIAELVGIGARAGLTTFADKLDAALERMST